jgi:hypothetical protein
MVARVSRGMDRKLAVRVAGSKLARRRASERAKFTG